MHGINIIEIFKEWIWKTTKNQKMIFLGQMLCLFLLFLGVLGPNMLRHLLMWQNSAFAKLTSGFGIIIYSPEIIKSIFNYFGNIEYSVDWGTSQSNASNFGKTIDGIQVDELIEYIFEVQGFPVDGIKKYFGLSNQEYKKLGDNLERLGILVRGLNNARILGEKSMNYIIQVLESNDDSDKIYYSESDNEKTFINL